MTRMMMMIIRTVATLCSGSGIQFNQQRLHVTGTGGLDFRLAINSTWTLHDACMMLANNHYHPSTSSSGTFEKHHITCRSRRMNIALLARPWPCVTVGGRWQRQRKHRNSTSQQRPGWISTASSRENGIDERISQILASQ